MSECIWIHYAEARPHWYGLDAATQAAYEKTMGDGGGSSARQSGRGLSYPGPADFETVEIWRFLSAEAAFEYGRANSSGLGDSNAFANNIGLRSKVRPDDNAAARRPRDQPQFGHVRALDGADFASTPENLRLIATTAPEVDAREDPFWRRPPVEGQSSPQARRLQFA